jgi:hypothetical protein
MWNWWVTLLDHYTQECLLRLTSKTFRLRSVKSLPKKKEAAPVKVKKPVAKSMSSLVPHRVRLFISIEACKQWGTFKTQASGISKAVGKKAIVEILKEEVS